jgi:hypothetical protein
MCNCDFLCLSCAVFPYTLHKTCQIFFGQKCGNRKNRVRASERRSVYLWTLHWYEGACREVAGSRKHRSRVCDHSHSADCRENWCRAWEECLPFVTNDWGILKWRDLLLSLVCRKQRSNEGNVWKKHQSSRIKWRHLPDVSGSVASVLRKLNYWKNWWRSWCVCPGAAVRSVGRS